MSNSTLTYAGDGILNIQGDFGFATVSELLKQGENLMDGHKELTIDFSGITGSDSAGIAVMLEWMDRCKAAGQQLHFRNVPESLLEIARVSNLTDLLPLTDT